MAGVDPVLVQGWLAARSLSRGLPRPVADHGGWRVDTGGEAELRRYVFAQASPGLTQLLATVAEPRVFVKLCADAATFGALLPADWTITDANYMMVPDRVVAASCALPPGYDLASTSAGGVTHVTITDPAGDTAASGYAAQLDGIFVYDRIVVQEAHRRRGLGRALMAALGAARDPATREILTATAMGAALYGSLGWRVYAPYTTATRLKSSPARGGGAA
ncbi:GNAT family N-acetyltransferase [Sphingomonas sp. RP10(2022)]|uniref:GNAT family N-acetyltransferase n=1 Tax=Sphingomonas liriopis TaxID=2949094 RepID=A0A9X2HQP3_9SPHN|nr:GNAT family N-acetyltransferase [Sphingomonas liriopis]MCP3735721.1 GNAT family N-acetyltransferase [Sphingomonas liriopis]